MAWVDELHGALIAIATPDAIQFATAISTNAGALFTNDARLPRDTGVEILLVDDLLS